MAINSFPPSHYIIMQLCACAHVLLQHDSRDYHIHWFKFLSWRRSDKERFTHHARRTNSYLDGESEIELNHHIDFHRWLKIDGKRERTYLYSLSYISRFAFAQHSVHRAIAVFRHGFSSLFELGLLFSDCPLVATSVSLFCMDWTHSTRAFCSEEHLSSQGLNGEGAYWNWSSLDCGRIVIKDYNIAHHMVVCRRKISGQNRKSKLWWVQSKYI